MPLSDSPYARGGVVPYAGSMSTTTARTSSMSWQLADVDWVKAQLKRYTYKPGWTFDVDSSLLGGPSLVITFKAEDTYHPGKEITVGSIHSLLFTMFGRGQNDPDHFAKWLSIILQDLEIHESREWLKRDGEIFDDPHAGQKRAR